MIAAIACPDPGVYRQFAVAFSRRKDREERTPSAF